MSFTDEMEAERAVVWGASMLPEVDALPRSQGESAMIHRNGEIDRGQSSSDVGGHVVVALGGMDKKPVAVGDKPSKEALKIVAHVGVSVFLDE